VYPVAGFLFSGGGASQELALPNAKITLSGGGASSELSLPNAKITFAGGGASCQLTLPNIALSLAGATGKTLTLTNSLTNQGGNDGILSWSGAYTLTIPATGTVALLGTAQTFTAIQTQKITDAGTATVISHVVNHASSGTPAASFGSGFTFQASDTTTADVTLGQISGFWTVATHATRAAAITFSVTDATATREVLRLGANNTAATLGFFAIGPVVRAGAFTQTYSTSSHTVPAITATNPPSGGTGTASGAYDTSSNRNLAITSLTAVIADVTALFKVVTAVIDDLQAYGLFQ
jgi:hypothetical protein